MNTSIPQRAPTILRSIAVAGVLVAIIGTIVIWVFLSDLEDTTDRSLLIGEQATVTLNETIDVAEQVLDAVDDGLVTVAVDTVDARRRAAVDGRPGGGDRFAVGDAARPASTTSTPRWRRWSSLGETVDSTLSALSSLPFGPDYDPDVPFPEAVADLRTALDPIADDLTTISDRTAELRQPAPVTSPPRSTR